MSVSLAFSEHWGSVRLMNKGCVIALVVVGAFALICVGGIGFAVMKFANPTVVLMYEQMIEVYVRSP